MDRREVSLAPYALRPQPVLNPWLKVLVDASVDEVGSLLRMRPDLALGAPSDLAQLAANALTPASALMFHENADRTTREVLEALCVLPPPVTEPSLASALGSAPGELSPLLVGLRLAVMVLIEADGSVVVNPGLASGLQCPARLGPPAAALLGHETNSQLMAVAKRLGLSPNGNKTDLVNRLARALSEPRRMALLLEAAPAGAADVAAKATHWPQLELNYGAAELARHDNNPVGWCLHRSLLVATRYSTVVMPREVGLALRGGRPFPGFTTVPPQLVLRSADQEALDSMAAGAALRLVRDVEAVCEALSELPAKPLQAGGLGVKELRRLGKSVDQPEQAVAQLVELAGWAGLVEQDGEAGWAVPTRDYDRWRASNSTARWVELASHWLSLPVHLTVAGSKDADGRLVPPLLDRGPDPNAMMQRGLLIDVVAGAAPGLVASEETVTGVAIWRRPSTWFSPLALPEELVHWVLEEAVLLGLAAGVGLGCQTVALSAFGRLLAEGGLDGAGKLLSELVPPAVDRVIFQADLTATAPGEAAPGLRSELDLLANLESGGNATVWRFSQASLRRGFDAGRNAVEIEAFLQRHAVHGVPQALSYLV
ncbi:MAG TPA: helicase-associated domain-containing protein, partial [Acidimicrobiales bacterium]|nr:helicase-associated domain-containing protein [Acidimicrobiales bacterium]